jgi:mannose-6-phosphate isomerase-like protein (cupin superfamily)
MITYKSVEEMISAWQVFLRTHPWETLIKDVTPKQTGCGPVYELPNYLERPDEGFAIADMRGLKVAEPHYHPDGNAEYYLILQGNGIVVIGGKEHRVEPGDALVIPPNTAHFTISDGIVLAAINQPALQPGAYIAVDSSQDNPELHFDADQFRRYAVNQ